MDKQYCKLSNSNVIFEIVEINKDKIKIRNGNIIVNTKKDKIRIIPNDNIAINNNSYCTFTTCTNDISNEIMLRHLTREEALEELDRYIYKAISCNMHRIKIIHGRHGNILRNAVREYLDNHPNVASYEYGMISEGGVGVTVAILKKIQKRTAILSITFENVPKISKH